MIAKLKTFFLSCGLLACTITGLQAGLQDLLAPVEPDEYIQPAPAEAIPEVTAVKKEKKTETVIADKIDIEKQLAQAIAAQGELNGQLSVTLLRPWKKIVIPGKKFYVELIELNNQQLRPSMIAHFRVHSDDEKIGAFNYPIRCQLWKEVLVPKAKIERDLALKAEFFGTRMIDTLAMGKQLVAKDTDVSKLESVRTVGAGQILEWSDVQVIPLVREGDIVEVVAAEGLLHITMKAQALEDGAKGEFIRLRNIQSRKDLQAEVINEKRARVHF